MYQAADEKGCVEKQKYNINSSNNQRLQSAGDNDQRSKRFCSKAVLYD